jgi:hypothetical protein
MENGFKTYTFRLLHHLTTKIHRKREAILCSFSASFSTGVEGSSSARTAMKFLGIKATTPFVSCPPALGCPPFKPAALK